MTDELPACKEFDQIVTTLRVQIPDSLDEAVNKLNGLGGLLTAGHWARAAFVRAWVEKSKPGPKIGLEIGQLSMREFAALGIMGLSSREAVRHYWHAWESTGLPKPEIGKVVDLPEIPFPEWFEGDNIMATKWTGDQESYTPAKYIEAAREVMGSIDLDPASNELAQKTVKAAKFYTKEENGLDKPWEGNIFLNPPYSHPDIKFFVEKLLAELKPGQQAILLTNNNTDTGFFHDAVSRAAAVCFTKGRINFLKDDGSISSPTNGQVFYYFGDNKEGFIKHFSKFGTMMERYDGGDMIRFQGAFYQKQPAGFDGVFDWVIIGPRREGKEHIQPAWDWVESLLMQAREAGCKVYFKPHLSVRPKEYPD